MNNSKNLTLRSHGDYFSTADGHACTQLGCRSRTYSPVRLCERLANRLTGASCHCQTATPPAVLGYTLERYNMHPELIFSEGVIKIEKKKAASAKRILSLDNPAALLPGCHEKAPRKKRRTTKLLLPGSTRPPPLASLSGTIEKRLNTPVAGPASQAISCPGLSQLRWRVARVNGPTSGHVALHVLVFSAQLIAAGHPVEWEGTSQARHRQIKNGRRTPGRQILLSRVCFCLRLRI